MPTLALLLSLLGGCALWPEEPSPERDLAPPFGAHREFQRSLSVHHGDDRVDRYQVSLTLTPEQTRIELHRPEGGLVLRLYQDRRNIEVERTALMPRTLPAEELLADIQLAFWPARVLRSGLVAPWTLEVRGDGRSLLFGERARSRVDYQGDTPWFKPVAVNNRRYDYLLVLMPTRLTAATRASATAGSADE